MANRVACSRCTRRSAQTRSTRGAKCRSICWFPRWLRNGGRCQAAATSTRAISPISSSTHQGDLYTELEQLAMNTRCTPERVVPTDPSDEPSDVGRNGRSANPSPRLPAPEQAKANSVPAQEGLWLEDDRRLEQGREQPIQTHKDQTVGSLQPGPGRRRPLQDDELAPQVKDLGFTPCLRLTPSR